MSASSPEPIWGFPRGPSLLPTYGGGRRGDALHERMMLELCFDGHEARWSDALIVRTRRHIGGCFATLEREIRQELEKTLVDGLDVANALPPDYCWRAIQRRPAIVSAALLRHCRDRAALSLMGQEAADIPAALAEIGRDGWLPADLADTLRMITTMVAEWLDTSPDHVPMPAQLPAELMRDLVWSVSALITDALVRTDLLPTLEMVALVHRAGKAVLERYDEQESPLAHAALFALRLRGAAIGDEAFLWLARNRHILPLLALIADRNGIQLRHVISTSVEGAEQMLFQLCRAAGLPREAAVRLVLARRGVARGVDDAALIEYSDQYDSLSRADAHAATMTLTLDEIYRERLTALSHWGAKDDG